MKLCDIKRNNPYIFNSWRGILYTEKGKRVGTSEEWKDFLTFFNDVSPTYRKGYIKINHFLKKILYGLLKRKLHY